MGLRRARSWQVSWFFLSPRWTPRAGHQPMSRETATRAAMAGSRLYGGPMAPVKQIQVTFDCAEPEHVARFWCEVLGYVVPPPPEGFATWNDFERSVPPEHQSSWFACVDPSGKGPRLFFQRVPEGKVESRRGADGRPCHDRVGRRLRLDRSVAAVRRRCRMARGRGLSWPHAPTGGVPRSGR
jgi:hypothetical protein